MVIPPTSTMCRSSIACCLFNNSVLLFIQQSCTRYLDNTKTFEHRRKKPCRGPAQIGLCSNRKWPEALSFGFRIEGLYYLCSGNKAADDRSMRLSLHMQK